MPWRGRQFFIVFIHWTIVQPLLPTNQPMCLAPPQWKSLYMERQSLYWDRALELVSFPWVSDWPPGCPIAMLRTTWMSPPGDGKQRVVGNSSGSRVEPHHCWTLLWRITRPSLRAEVSPSMPSSCQREESKGSHWSSGYVAGVWNGYFFFIHFVFFLI